MTQHSYNREGGMAPGRVGASERLLGSQSLKPVRMFDHLHRFNIPLAKIISSTHFDVLPSHHNPVFYHDFTHYSDINTHKRVRSRTIFLIFLAQSLNRPTDYITYRIASQY
ncbi:hypothetical protein J1614_008672 [Plenodomus biglobosus]|nr:hypothetical protein J1614_008672 [Plenodomus biglobosus]